MNKNKVYILAMTSLMLFSCGNQNDNKETVSIAYSGNSEQVKFALSDIGSAINENGFSQIEGKAKYSIIIDEIDPSLGEQGYSISLDNNVVTVKGGDETGLMYGGLQVAENIKLNHGILGMENVVKKPDIVKRGLKAVPSLDLRTPNYCDLSDSSQINLENTWDINYWSNYFDEMARMRYNYLVFRVQGIFSQFVQVPGYENCIVEDVWKYNGTYDDSFGGTANDYLRPEMLEEGQYTVIKKMTIQEKIQYWNQVIDLAINRGIDFQLDYNNVYLYGETYDSTQPAMFSTPSRFADISQDYGLTCDLENEITKDYYRKAVAEIIKTYPKLQSMGIYGGENMEYKGSEEGFTMKWLYDTYGKGIEDGLKGTDRNINLTLNLTRTNLASIKSAWASYPYKYDVEGRYASTHMQALTNPTFLNDSIADCNADKDVNLHVVLRNEDFYHYKWTNPAWIKELLTGIKSKNITAYFLSSDHINPMNTYMYLDQDLNSDLYLKTQWYYFTLFGRFGYDNSLSLDYAKKLFENHYSTIDKALVDKAYDLMTDASNILISINKQYFEGGTDRLWYPELCTSHPSVLGFLTVKKWAESDNAYPDSGVMSIVQYAKALAEGQTTFELTTPSDIVKSLKEFATKSLDLANEIESSLKANTKEEKDFKTLVLDQKSWAYLGQYYAGKIEGAYKIRLYNDTQDKTYQEQSIAALTTASQAWKNYADNFKDRFKVERSTRYGMMDPVSLQKNVDKDITLATNWKVKTY